MEKYTRSSSLREQVYQRDGGFCALCGCDTEKTLAAYRYALDHLQFFCGGKAFRMWRDLLRISNFDGFRQTWWDADHIHPLSEGGKDCLSNLRTLCQPCHKYETAKLARRAAKAARLQEKDKHHKYQQYQLYRIQKQV